MEREREDDPYEAIQFGDFGTYIRHKKQKLQLQQEETAALAAPNTAQIFEGIVVYVNGYTDPPIHELKNMIVQRGGEFRQYLSKNSTTHIIASNLTQAKMREFRNYKVAKPEWITESVKANRLLQWHKFSTLNVPSSFSKFGEASSTQSLSMTSSSPSCHTNSGSSTDPKHKDHDSAPLGLLEHTHVDLPDRRDKDSHMLGKAARACTSGDADVALGVVGSKLKSVEPFPEDEDMFLDDLVLDHFESQPTPPTNAFEATTESPVDHDSESDRDPQPKTHLSPEHANVGAAVSVDINSSNGHEATPDKRHPTLIELSVPWNRLNSSVQPGFVEKFYQSSRLHYLSTWKIRLRDITTEIQKDRAPVLSRDKNKIIMHVDFDCFFASVATRKKPELRDQPIAVAHGTGGSTSNSEIASCNYLAREYGVKNGMQLLRARKLCPDLLVVPYEFQEYEDISIEFYKILLAYADELQAVSVDEALLDVTSKCLPPWDKKKPDYGRDVSSSRMSPEMLAKRVREEIFLATGCHASVGVAPNVLLAKLSTKRAKPHGQFIWPGAPGSEETLRELRGPKSLPMDVDIDTSLTPSSSEGGSQLIKHDLPVANQSNNFKEFSVNDLPGVGYKTKQELQERFSVRTLYELQRISKEELQRICGMKTGEMLYNSCRGIDETTLASDRDKARQSVSAEISWGVRFENQDQVDIFLRDLAREVSKRLKEIDRKGKSIVMKVMKRKEYVDGRWKHLGHGPVDQFVRTGQLPMYTDDPNVIAKEARTLLQYFKIDVLDIRGLGIQVLKLNNDVINGVPRTAFASLDSMNQTTLSKAMFQRKAPTPNASDSVASSKIQLSERQAPPKSMELSGLNSEVSQGDLTLEIDNETFKELPTDIQEELLRHHRFVFVNQNGSETTITTSSKEMQLNGRPGFDSCVSLHHGSKDKDLPQTAVDRVFPPWSQVDPAELMSLSTPMMRDALNEYAGMNRNKHARSSSLHIDDPQQLETSILPSPSKLDRSVLQSLPPEIRAEIEQEYTHIMENNELIRKLARPTSNHTVDSSSASLSHQPIFTDNQGGSRGRGKGMRRGSTRGRPRGRGRGRGREFGNLSNGIECVRIVSDDVDEALRESREKESEHKSLQQSVPDREISSGDTHVPPLDSEFLAALPPDIRAELETAHKVEIMKSRRKRATHAALTKDQSTAVYDAEYSKECRTRVDRSVLIERPTLMGLSHLDEIRDMLGEWVQSTLLREEEGATNIYDVHDVSSSTNPRMIIYDEGPNPEDVWSFSEYIARVIFMERDLDKVRLLLRFLERKIEDNKRKATPAHLSPKHLQVLISWPEALKSISSVAEHLVVVLYGGTFATD